MEKIKIENKQQFIEGRSKGIGASEVSGLLGVSDYLTPYKLWLRKTGKEEEFEGNVFTKAGHMLENAVANYFNEVSGYRVIKNTSDNYRIEYPDNPLIFCHPDREYFASYGRSPLECKTTQRNIDKDDIPLDWFCQIQYQLGCMQKEVGSIAWLSRGLNFDYMEFDFDKEFFEEIEQKVNHFWTEHVLKDIPPDSINEADLKIRHPKSIDGREIIASEEMEQAYSNLVSIKDQIKVLDSKKKKLETQIKLAMKDCESVRHSGSDQLLFTWKSNEVRRLDSKKVKEKNLTLYNQCCNTSFQRRFLVK